MNCDRTRNLILLETTGELSDRERSELSGHLESCAGCREYRSFQSRLFLELEQGMPGGEPSEAVMARITAAAEERARRSVVITLPAWNKMLAWAATCLVVASGAVYLNSRGSEHPAIAEVGAILAVESDSTDAERYEFRGTRQEMMRQLGRELLHAEGLGENGDDMTEAILLYEPESTDPRSSNTSASRPAIRA